MKWAGAPDAAAPGLKTGPNFLSCGRISIAVGYPFERSSNDDARPGRATTLSRFIGTLRVLPAVAAGVTDRLSEVADLVAALRG